MLTGLQVHKQTAALPSQNATCCITVSAAKPLCHLACRQHPADSNPHRKQLACQASLLNSMQHDGTAFHAWQVFPPCVHLGSPGLLALPCPCSHPALPLQ